jgi:hypothetical protein
MKAVEPVFLRSCMATPMGARGKRVNPPNDHRQNPVSVTLFPGSESGLVPGRHRTTMSRLCWSGGDGRRFVQ